MSGPGRGRPWLVEQSRGAAGDHHARDLPEPPARRVWIHRVDRPALVLGSTQSLDLVDQEATAAAGIDVVRRRSGGGAVLVEPGGVVWVDVVIPPDDPLADDDVGRAAGWVGDAWAAALADVGIPGGEVHRGALVQTPWSRVVCFGGLGPGEVTVGGRKVVGVAQRRTRLGARFQTATLRRWEPGTLVGLLRLEDPAAAVADLSDRAMGVEVGEEPLLDALLARLDGLS